MRVKLKARNREWTFSADSDESLLRAALRAGLDAPYECATGTCGSCRVQVTGGEVDDAWPQAPGRGSEPTARLMCQCRPLGDCVIETKSYVYSIDASNALVFQTSGRIKALRRLNNDVIELVVETQQRMPYRAGQFATLSHPAVHGPRGYSMTRYNTGNHELSFVIKRLPGGGWSEWLFNEQERLIGEGLTVTGPYGRADFSPELGMNIACIAGGSGVAGMRAIIERAVHDNYFQQYRGALFFGVRNPRDAFWLQELNALSVRGGDKLDITIAFSEGEASPEQVSEYPHLHFATGMVHETAAQALKGRFSNLRAYLAGPPKAVDAAQRMLLVEGKLSPGHIRYDKFC